MQLSDTELNRIADYIVASAMTCRIHTADPGTSGTTARIGSLSQNLAAATWSNGSGGDVQYNADVSFGVVDAAAAQAVTHYSLWRGNDFVGRGALSATVSVTAGGTFKINTGTIDINGST